jgi:tetratricopeptide (TPR) repeat protein
MFKLFSFLFPKTASGEPAKKRVPQDPESWREEAFAAEQRGNWTRAVVCYRRALSLAPFAFQTRALMEEALDLQILAEQEKLPNKVIGTAANLRILEVEQRSGDNPDHGVAQQEGFWQDDQGVESPSRRKTVTAEELWHRRQRKQWFSKIAFLGAGGLAAVTITAVGLYGAVLVVTSLGSIFSSEELPQIVQVEESLPDALTITMRAASQLIISGKPEQASQKLLTAKDEFPQFEEVLSPALAQAFRSEGNQLMRKGRFEQAANVFKKASENDPENPLNYIDLGRSLCEFAMTSKGSVTSKRQILDDAKASLETALEYSPDDSTVLLELAQVHKARNNRRLAVETYKKVVALAPSSLEGSIAQRALDQLTPR